MKRLTARSLMSHDGCLRLGEIVFFPWLRHAYRPRWMMLNGYLKPWHSSVLNRSLASNDWFFQQLEERQEIRAVDDRPSGQLWLPGIEPHQYAHGVVTRLTAATESPQSPSWLIMDWYKMDRHEKHAEPAWVHQISRDLRRALRAQFIAYFDEYGEQFFSLYPGYRFLPPPYPINFSGIGYAFQEEGLIAGAFEAFCLNRLEGVNQLGWLRDPIPDDVGEEGPGQKFDTDDHQRYPHLADAPVLASLIIRNSRRRISARLARHIIAAAASHDGATPAGGDTTKLLDRKVFDEERQFRQLLTTAAFRRYARTHDLNRTLLTQIVRGQHPLGSAILDVVDKLSYVSRDVTAFLMTSRVLTATAAARRYPTDGFGEVARLIKRYPLVCAIWEAFRVRGGRLVCTDRKRLARFLRLRALMFREVYYNPASRGEDHTIMTSLLRCLWQGGEITSEELFTCKDWELTRHVGELTGVDVDPKVMMVNRPLREAFTDEESARVRERELIDQHHIVVLEDLRHATGDGTKLLVTTPTGVKPFAKAMPKATARIQEILAVRRRINLYAVPIGRIKNLNPEFAARLAAFERQRVGLPAKETAPGI